MYKAKIDFPVYDKSVLKEFKKGDTVELSEEGLLDKLVKSGRCELCKAPKAETKVIAPEENKIEEAEAPKPKTTRKTRSKKK